MALMSEIFLYQLECNFRNAYSLLFVVMYLFDVWTSVMLKVCGSICCNSFLNPHINNIVHSYQFTSVETWILYLPIIISFCYSCFSLSVISSLCLSVRLFLSNIIYVFFSPLLGRDLAVVLDGLRWSRLEFIEDWLRSIIGLFSSFRAICRTGWDGWDWLS